MSKLSCPVFLIILMLPILGAFGQTMVGGSITENTTWSKAESPYVVTENVVIYPNVKLKIEAGVEVRFHTGTGLEFRDAQAELQGSVQEPIYFKLDSEDPSNITVDDYWSGINFKSSSGAFVDRSLAFLRFEHAIDALAFQNEPGFKYVDHCEFQNNLTAISNGSQNFTWLDVDNNFFANNRRAIVGRMNINNSVFLSNEIAVADPLFFQNENVGGRIENSRFEANQLAIGYDEFQVNFARLLNCQFINNDRAIDLYQLRADSCLFQGSDVFALSFDQGWLRNSLVTDNQIGVVFSSFGFYPELLGNTIRNNQIGLQLYSEEVSVLGNRICHNEQFNLQVSTGDPVNVADNCWCTDDLSTISQTVWDQNDDSFLGQAQLSPINAGCGSGQSVYPGDSELDNRCGITDVLWMGWAYGATGPIRTDLGISWAGHNGADWTQTFADGRNYKHADADGNGVVEEDDLLAVEQNHGETNDLSGMGAMQLVAPGAPGGFELVLPDTIYANQTITVPVTLGTEDAPIDLHGLAFQIELPEDFVQLGSVSFTANNSWLGDDLLVLVVQDDLVLDIALSRKDQDPESGWGEIGQLSFILSEDIVGQQTGEPNVNGEVFADFEVKIYPLLGIIDDQYKINLYGSTTGSVLTDVSDIELSPQGKLTCSPNPVSDRINLSLENLEERGNIYHIWDINGRSIATGAVESDIELSTTNWKSGIYQLQIMSAAGQSLYSTSLIKQ